MRIVGKAVAYDESGSLTQVQVAHGVTAGPSSVVYLPIAFPHGLRHELEICLIECLGRACVAVYVHADRDAWDLRLGFD